MLSSRRDTPASGGCLWGFAQPFHHDAIRLEEHTNAPLYENLVPGQPIMRTPWYTSFAHACAHRTNACRDAFDVPFHETESDVEVA